MTTVKITVDNRTIIRVALALVALVLAFNFFRAVKEPLALVGISFFLALALNNPVNYLSNRITRGSRGLATGIAYLVVVSIIGGFLYASVPPLMRQTSTFVDEVPQYIERLESGEGAVGDFIRRYNLDSELRDYVDDFGSRIGDSSGSIFSGISRVGSVIFKILTVLVLTFFMIVEGPAWGKSFWGAVPAASRSRYQALAERMHRIITGYVNGQLLIALLAGLAALVASLLVGLPSPLTLAGLISLFALIPLVGATLGAVVVVTVAFFQSVAAGVIMAVFFLIYQQIENNVIQPYIQSRALDVSPLLVLVAVIMGVYVGGLLGGFIAIPTAACARILFLDFYSKRLTKAEA